MSKYNLFFLRPRYNMLDKIKSYFSFEFDVLNPDFQLYVPSKFVVGPFKQVDESDLFELDESRFYFKNSFDVLEEYKNNFNESRFDIISVKSINESELERFLKKGEVFNSAKSDISSFVKKYV